MLRVLFVNASDPLSEFENRYPPLWPGYLAAYAKARHGGGRFDFRFASGRIDDELDAFQPDAVAIGSVSGSFGYAQQIARMAKERGAFVAVGGPHITVLPSCLTDDMDVGVIGEGEETFSELAGLLLENPRPSTGRLAGVKGIVHHRNGDLRTTPLRPPIPRLDDIPHPDRSLFGPQPDAYIISSRGCPYHCSFCASSRLWPRIRFNSAEYVVDEIAELIAQGSRIIRFNDDLFVANKKRLGRIADLMEERGLSGKVAFGCNCRANLVTEELVRLLKRLNVVSVTMGLESGSDRVLRFLKGDVTVEDNRRAIDLLKDGGVQANGFFIIGSPDETADEIMETYNFIRKSRIDFLDVFVLTPLPGTPVWDEAQRMNIVSDDMDWRRLNISFQYDRDHAVVMSQTLDREELDRLYRRFRRLRFYRILRALPRSPWLRHVPRVAGGMLAEKARRLRRRIFGRPRIRSAGRPKGPTGS